MFQAAKSELVSRIVILSPLPHLSKAQNWALGHARPKDACLNLLLRPTDLQHPLLELKIWRKVRQRCRDVCGSATTTKTISIEFDGDCVQKLIADLDLIDRQALADYFVITEWRHWVSHDLCDFRFVRDENKEWVASDGNTEKYLGRIVERKAAFRKKLEELHKSILLSDASK